MQFVLDWLWAFWAILVDSGLWLIVGFLLAGVLHEVVPRRFLQRLLGGRGLAPIVRGAVVGAPIPLCSCSVIPTAAGLRRSGASPGATAAFAVASPEVDIPAVGLTWGLLGPWFAVTRPIVAVASALATGLSMAGRRFAGDEGHDASREQSQPQASERLVSLSVMNQPGQPVPAAECCATEPGSTSRTNTAPAAEPPSWSRGLRFAFVTLPGSLAGWMLLGLATAALVTVLVPEGWLTDAGLPGGLLTQCLLALVVGLPLYVCATSSTPLALAMLAAGVEPGAALVFLLAGPATNPATIAWVSKDFGVNGAARYVAVIAIGSVACGLALNGVLASHLPTFDAHAAHEHGGSLLEQFAAGLLLAVLLVPWGLGLMRRVGGLEKQVAPAEGGSCCSSGARNRAS